jgi:7-carboxy-7-deazaguanine synthase
MYFVRLQGCDVGCYFCDTKYTWRDKSPTTHEEDIIMRAKSSGVKWVCVTGGEPYEQDLSKLVALANDNKLYLHIETSGGADWQPFLNIDWICLSPKDLFTKKQFETRREFKIQSNEIKCVVTKESDIDYYIDHYYSYCFIKPLIFQPVDNNTKLVDAILHKIKEKRLWQARCMLQVHKMMALR